MLSFYSFPCLRRWLTVGIFVSLATLFGGCGGGDKIPGHKRMIGKVTFQSKPLASATVFFWAASNEKQYQGRYTIGMTNENGEFALKSSSNLEGIAPGNYAVTFSCVVDKNTKKPLQGETKPSEASVETIELIPVRYRNREQSPEKVEVTSSGENRFVFQLKR